MNPGPGHGQPDDSEPAVDHQTGLRDRFGFPAALRLSPKGLPGAGQCRCCRRLLLGHPDYRTQSASFRAAADGYAMAVSSTLCGAVLVENGQRFSASDAFVNQQWLWLTLRHCSAGFSAVSWSSGCRRQPHCTAPRRLSRARVPPSSRSAGAGLGGIHGLGLRLSPIAAATRQAPRRTRPGARHPRRRRLLTWPRNSPLR